MVSFRACVAKSCVGFAEEAFAWRTVISGGKGGSPYVVDSLEPKGGTTPTYGDGDLFLNLRSIIMCLVLDVQFCSWRCGKNVQFP
jgi:hypothetical protein